MKVLAWLLGIGILMIGLLFVFRHNIRRQFLGNHLFIQAKGNCDPRLVKIKWTAEQHRDTVTIFENGHELDQPYEAKGHNSFLVYYEGELMSLSELDTLKANFGRPVTANFGWNTDWTNTFSTGLTATYSGSYTTAIKSSSDQQIGIGSECTTCEAVEIFVPKYEAHTFDSRIMFALSSRWNYQISQSLIHLNFSSKIEC